jgi:hypothetical protein
MGVFLLSIIACVMSLGLYCQQNDITKKIRIKDTEVSSRVVRKRFWAIRIMQLTKNQAACVIVIILKQG